ncbi:MAG: type VI secretion system Vgr family protein [Lautropia sp.]
MARLCTLTSPLGDALLFARMHVSERLSTLSTIQLEAVSEKGDIQPADLLGKSLTIKVDQDDGAVRFYNGHVTRIALGGMRGRYHAYHLTLHAWPWFLTRTADCRIFQGKTVPEIVDEVLSDAGFTHVDWRLDETYAPWDYCVQYRETDFNFVSRLLEQEGITWFFEHADGEHKLVLVDRSERHAPITGEPAIRYTPDSTAQTFLADRVTDWSAAQEIQPDRYVIDDYDFKAPSKNLEVVRKPELPPPFTQSQFEVYDYPGEFDTHPEGEAYVASRIEELHVQTRAFEGAGALRQFHVGRRFKLTDHPRKDQNGEYLLVSVEYDYSDPPYESGDGEGTEVRCRFTAIPSNQQFRPPRSTPRPFVQGIQTAVVTGPAGEEIFTDQYGRIKVQFHWDRLGKNDERSSCWLRVAFLAAGPRFGFVSIPRIGHEVVVDFLEGDPDRPLVTGVVYNGANMPPWTLPDNKTQSGLLTRSSLKGSPANANAIRFEDKKGAEQVWIHAEKNQDIEVENDETHWVGHDRSKTIDHDETTKVGHDRTETVGNNETIAIGNNRTETVAANESVTIGMNRTHAVGASETWTVSLQRTHTVGVNETISIGAAQQVSIGAMQAINVGANQTTSVGNDQSTDVGSNQSTNVGKDRSTTIGDGDTLKVGKDQAVDVGGGQATTIGKDQTLGVGDNRTTSIGKDDSLTVGKNLVVSAGDSITLKTGSASLTLKKDGSIVLKGKDIVIEGSGKITVKASGDIVMKGSKILQN